MADKGKTDSETKERPKRVHEIVVRRYNKRRGNVFTPLKRESVLLLLHTWLVGVGIRYQEWGMHASLILKKYSAYMRAFLRRGLTGMLNTCKIIE